ncbi:MAG: phosphatidate cytidylyltransferase [Methylocella sp.]
MSRFLQTPVPVAMLNDSAAHPPSDDPPPLGVREAMRERRRRLADLLPRFVSGLILAAAALTAVWRGGVVFAFIWFCGALAVGLEWQNLIGAGRPRLRFLIVAAGLALTAFFGAQGELVLACGVLGLGGLALALAAGPGRRVWAFGGLVYAGSLIVSVYAIYAAPAFGPRAIFWLFATVWGTDVFAYFGGRLIGGPKLWPQISPSKTWSGTLSGVFAGALIGAAIGVLGLGGGRFAAPIFALGLVAALLSQAGDIFESIVKRRFGAKDSSALIPGHGGFMDRLDGFVAAAAFMAVVAALHGPLSAPSDLFDWL